MLDRLFGRNKDDNQEPTCAACGRTLLPGEWAQTVIADDGREEIICSLCAQSGVGDGMAAPVPEPLGEAGAPIPVSGRPQPLRPRQGRESHEESDAFWRALKEKDAEIERLRSEAARAEAERQELVAQLSLLQRQLSGEAITDWQVAAPFAEQPAQTAAVAFAAEPQPVLSPEPRQIDMRPAAAEEAAATEAAAAQEAAQLPAQTGADPQAEREQSEAAEAVAAWQQPAVSPGDTTSSTPTTVKLVYLPSSAGTRKLS